MAAGLALALSFSPAPWCCTLTAFQHFFNQGFPAAAHVFNKILKNFAKDPPVRFFLNKASRYSLEGVDEDWTGVEETQSK